MSFGWMLIACSAGILVFGGGTIILELLKVFFPKKVKSFMVGTTRQLRRLMCQPSPNAVAPFVNTSEGPGKKSAVMTYALSLLSSQAHLSSLALLLFDQLFTI
jgi:hypothetical protein